LAEHAVFTTGSKVVCILCFAARTIVVDHCHYLIDSRLLLIEISFQNRERAIVNLMVLVHL